MGDIQQEGATLDEKKTENKEDADQALQAFIAKEDVDSIAGIMIPATKRHGHFCTTRKWLQGLRRSTLPTADSWYRKVQGYLSSLQRRVEKEALTGFFISFHDILQGRVQKFRKGGSTGKDVEK